MTQSRHYNHDYTPNPLTYDEAKEFAEHPLRVYDTHGAKDANAFRNIYKSFVQFIKVELDRIIELNCSDLEARKHLAELKTMYHTVRTKVDNYAYHSGVALLPKFNYNKSSRKLSL